MQPVTIWAWLTPVWFMWCEGPDDRYWHIWCEFGGASGGGGGGVLIYLLISSAIIGVVSGARSKRTRSTAAYTNRTLYSYIQLLILRPARIASV